MSDIIKMAHEFASEAHKGQERKFTGEPYTKHLEETSQMLWEVTEGNASTDMYVAAILHDVVEDTEVTLEEVGRHFGGYVMSLVGELTIDDRQKEIEGKKVYLSRKINEMSDPALLIKLCDRLNNVGGLEDKRIPDKFVKWYIKETQYILEHLTRELGSVAQQLIRRIEWLLMYLKLNRNLNG